MDKAILPTSENQLPEKWKPKYRLKRIGEDDIIISQPTRNIIVKQLQTGGKFVQIGEFTIMLNSIKSIDPFWPPLNIPPRPRLLEAYDEIPGDLTRLKARSLNQDELDEWDKYFKDKMAIEKLSD